MLYIIGRQENPAGPFRWGPSVQTTLTERAHGHDLVRVELYTCPWVNQRVPEAEARVEVIRGLKAGGDGWLLPAKNGDWLINAPAIPECLTPSSWGKTDWFNRHYRVRPSYEVVQDRAPSSDYLYRNASERSAWRGRFTLVVENEAIIYGPFSGRAPEGVREAVLRLRSDHPVFESTGFLMMSFSRTKAHANLASAIRAEFLRYDLEVLRADDRQYHDNLFENVLTYLYGASFGVAVFDRIEDETHNPNVSLEAGYMLALGRPVLLLKDRTLKTLPTDLMGRLYKTFDPHSPKASLSKQIRQWLSDKAVVSKATDQEQDRS